MLLLRGLGHTQPYSKPDAHRAKERRREGDWAQISSWPLPGWDEDAFLGFSYPPTFTSITAFSTTMSLITWCLSPLFWGDTLKTELLRTQSTSYALLYSQHLAHQMARCGCTRRALYNQPHGTQQALCIHQICRLTNEWPGEQAELTFQRQTGHPMSHHDAIS